MAANASQIFWSPSIPFFFGKIAVVTLLGIITCVPICISGFLLLLSQAERLNQKRNWRNPLMYKLARPAVFGEICGLMGGCIGLTGAILLMLTHQMALSDTLIFSWPYVLINTIIGLAFGFLGPLPKISRLIGICFLFASIVSMILFITPSFATNVKAEGLSWGATLIVALFVSQTQGKMASTLRQHRKICAVLLLVYGLVVIGITLFASYARITFINSF